MKAIGLDADSDDIRQRHAIYVQAEKQWEEAQEIVKPGWLRRKIIDTKQWQNAMELLKEIRESLGPTDRKLRSPELKPSFGLDEFGDNAVWEKAVAEVVASSSCYCVLDEGGVKSNNLDSRFAHLKTSTATMLIFPSRKRCKMKSMISGFCYVALFSVLGFAQHASSPMADQQFVDFAAQTDMMEANLGQLAGTQASAENVKDYAQTLVTDHTNDYTQLSMVAGKGNLEIPKGLDAAHDKMIVPFKKLKGTAFDHRYIQEMIAGHTKAIQVYTKEAADAQSADLKAYASQVLPTLQKHLEDAKALSPAKRHPKK